ncbi:MAG: site-specific integrase [Fulvivirga sp.]
MEKDAGKQAARYIKELKLKFNSIEAEAIQVIEKIQPFSFEEFKDRFYREHKNTDVIGALELYKESLKSENREGSADTFKCTISSFQKYLSTVKKDNLLFNEVTPSFLASYEKWMLKKGTSLNTIGIYLRNLRTVFNKAITEDVVDPGKYPFGKGKYMIPKETKAKTALDRQDLKLLFEYQPQNEMEEWARDIWLFSYLCNGMNLKDIAKLQYKNIDWENSRLTFLRTKTSRSRKHNTKQIIVPLSDWTSSRSCIGSPTKAFLY